MSCNPFPRPLSLSAGREILQSLERGIARGGILPTMRRTDSDGESRRRERIGSVKVEARVLEYESTVQGERVAMSIDTSALAHIMSVLTDLYSDPELAVLREYATNALDAHIEAGETRPIEVTLPTSLSPFVRIRDYGNGLDAEDIRNVFSRYGTSTKRDSDDVVGMLGLGCKSALSYADQFTFTGVKDGVRTEVLVSRDEDGSGTMSIVDESPSDDPSGTEIVVPAKSANGFERKASELFRFWTEGTVLVNGEAPERVGGVWLSDSFLLSTETDTDIVVMGNVPYPVPDEYDSRRKYGYGVRHRTIRFVDIGTVSFTPSREALQLTKRTKAFLESLHAERESLVATECLRLVAEASSASDAIRIARECRAFSWKGTGIYQGREVPSSLDRTERDANGNVLRTDPGESPSKSFLVAGQAYGRKNGNREWTTDFDIVAIFEGYDSKELTPTKREKIASYLESKSLPTRGKIVLVSKLSASERFWTEGIPVVDWSIVDAIKISRETRPSSYSDRPRGAYVARLADGSFTEKLEAEDIDPALPLFYVHGSSGTISCHPAIREAMLPEDSTVVALGANRMEKFRRDFPSAISLDEAARRSARDWTRTLDAEIVRAYVYVRDTENASALSRLDADAILDPDLRESVKLAKIDTTKIAEGTKRFRGYLPEGFAVGSSKPNPLAKYPLVRSLLDRSYGGLQKLEGETIIYVNASYLARSSDGDPVQEGR